VFVTLVAPAEAGRARRAGVAAPVGVSTVAAARRWWPVLSVAVLIGVRRAELPWDDGDVLWGIRAGQDTIRDGLPHVDAYSWTAHGATWVPNSWAWNVVLAAVNACGGLSGIAVLAAGLVLAVGGAVAVSARRAGATPVATALVLQAVAGLALTFFYARAQLVDYVAVLALPLVAGRALRADPGRTWFAAAGWTVVAEIVWMNLHTTAVVGPALVAAYGIGSATGAAVTKRGVGLARVLARASVLTAACAAGCLVTPYGLAPLANIGRVRAASAGLVAEWAPIGVGSPLQLLDLLLVGAAVAAAAFACRARRYESVAVLAVVVVLAVTAVRFAPLAGLSAVPELAAALSGTRVRPAFLARILLVTTGLMLAWTATGTAAFAAPGSDFYDPALVAAVPAHCRLLNDYDIGGDLVLQRRDVEVSIDGRNDLYGRARELRQLRAWNDPAAGLRFVDRRHVGCVLGPGSAPLTRALTRRPGWTVEARDAGRALLVRTSVLSPPPRPARARFAARPR